MIADVAPDDVHRDAFGIVCDTVETYQKGRRFLLFGRYVPQIEHQPNGLGTVASTWLEKWLYSLPGEERIVERTLPTVCIGDFVLRRKRFSVLANMSSVQQTVETGPGVNVELGPLCVTWKESS